MKSTQPEIWDISVAVDSATPVWPGSSGAHLHRVRDIADGDPVNESDLKMNLHVGTHIDAPLHFLPDGKSVDELPVDVFGAEAAPARALLMTSILKEVAV